MKLVIAEKPDIAKAISRVLPGSPSVKSGYYEQGEYCLTWCYGHLLTLKDPEDYGEQYARNNTPNTSLPIFFDDWEMKVGTTGTALLKNGRKPPDKKKQVETIGELLNRASSVIIAGDVDDEGQLLVEELLDWHNYTGPKKRLDTGALNEASLKKALANLMDNDTWHLRALSAKARSVADFAHGINFSRFFSNMYGINLSVGRVQSATLGLVVQRDAEIDGHNKKKYYILDVDACDTPENKCKCQPRFFPAEDNAYLIDGKIEDKTYLEKIGNAVNGKTLDGIVIKEKADETAPLPFSISALKSHCSAKFGITPENTLKITQSLRMNYGGLITYNRSECRYLPENMHAEAPGVISSIIANLGSDWNFPGLDHSKKSKAFNDKNITAHHGIIPTSQKADISKLKDDELKVYKAICGYYLIQFMPVCERERTKLVINGSGGNSFVASSIKVLSKGFRTVLPSQGDDEETELSKMNAGTYKWEISNPVISEKETQPPRRYTDALLEEDMKSVAKYVQDPEAKRLLMLKDKDSKEEKGSIGTAATRSAIIQTLKKRNFIEDKGKNIVSTELGRKFYNLLPDEIRRPDITAKWWAIQQDIQDGGSQPEDLYKDILSEFNKLKVKEYPKVDLSAFKTGSSSTRTPLGACPRCGGSIIEGKKGFGCSEWKAGCKFSIWKEGKFGVHKVFAASKKKVTKTMVKELLKSGKVLVRNLHSEKTGKSYDAWVVMVDTGEYVQLNLSFDDIPKKRKKS